MKSEKFCKGLRRRPDIPFRHLLWEIRPDDPSAPVMPYLDCSACASASACANNVVNVTNTPLLNQIRQFRGYGTILSEETAFTGNYNALQRSLNKQLGTTVRQPQ